MKHLRTVSALGAIVALLAGLGVAQWVGKVQKSANPAIEALFVSKITLTTGDAYPIKQLRGKPALINVWAPWCAPCVEELPELSALASSPEALGVQFIGLGVDNAPNISDFSIKYPVSFPLLVAGTAGTELAKALDNKAGALPFTVLINAQGQIVAKKTGRVTSQEVKAWLLMLNNLTH